MAEHNSLSSSGAAVDEHQALASLAILARAIAANQLVRAAYNRGQVTLAPYALYEKDDAVFLDAATVERDGMPPREIKLGAFRLTGLRGVVSTSLSFDADPELVGQLGRHSGQVLARVA